MRKEEIEEYIEANYEELLIEFTKGKPLGMRHWAKIDKSPEFYEFCEERAILAYGDSLDVIELSEVETE